MNLTNLANLDRFPASSMTPNLMLVENSLQKAGYNFSSIFLIMSKVFLTNFFLITFKSLCCCNCSLETFRGKSSESTTPEIFKIQFNVVRECQNFLQHSKKVNKEIGFSHLVFGHQLM